MQRKTCENFKTKLIVILSFGTKPLESLAWKLHAQHVNSKKMKKLIPQTMDF